jgi:hypothetical protein
LTNDPIACVKPREQDFTLLDPMFPLCVSLLGLSSNLLHKLGRHGKHGHWGKHFVEMRNQLCFYHMKHDVIDEAFEGDLGEV